MKKTTLLASVSTALLVGIAGCATTETKPAAAATAEETKPAEGSCGAEKKADAPADAKAGEGSCGEGSCGAAPK